MNSTERKESRGQSLVEAALTLPILIMLMLGLLDFGRAYYALVALRDAADEGATYAAVSPGDVLGIRRRASEASRELVPIDPNDVDIIYPPSLHVGAPITVTTMVHLKFYTPFANEFFPNDSIELHGRATHPIISVK